MALFEIPLTGNNQAFNIQLAGVLYRLRLVWRGVPDGRWFMDIGFPNGTALINGLPLTMGNNMLRQHQHILPGVLFMVSDDGTEPTFDNLGVHARMFWMPPQ